MLSFNVNFPDITYSALEPKDTWFFTTIGFVVVIPYANKLPLISTVSLIVPNFI